MTTEQKLNTIHLELRNNIKDLCYRNLSYNDRKKLQILLDQLDSLNKAYQTQVQELKDKLAPSLPPVPEKDKPEWKN